MLIDLLHLDFKTQRHPNMDAETQRRKRQEALEEKKKRLEEMRKNKQSRDQSQPADSAPSSSSVPPLSTESNINMDDLVNSLLTTSIGGGAQTSITPQASVTHESQRAETADDTRGVATASVQAHVPKKIVKLVVVKSIAAVQIQPTIGERYDKDCQTDPQEENEDSNPATDTKTPSKLDRKRPAPAMIRLTRSDSLSASDMFHDCKADPVSQKQLSDSDKQAILQSASFCSFVESSCRIIDRALAQSSNSIDILRDYVSDSSDTAGSHKTGLISLRDVFEDDTVRHRPVMDVQFSSSHPELFLASYGARSGSATRKVSASAADEPQGLVYVWSAACPTCPEFRFQASSPVLCARFHDEEPRLVIGGCYTGQILLWDMRAKALPVQRTSLSGKGHKHPVYSMCVSTAPADLVTISTDGTLCHWDIARLNDPTNVVSLSTVAGGGTTGSSSANAGSLIINGAAFGVDNGSGYRDLYLGVNAGSLCRTQLPIKAADGNLQV
jgi:dynein intermediate chain